jgi:O-antigen/teichoic acid export membrane protein
MASVDRLALTGAVGPTAVGQYFAAFQIASVLSMGSAALNQAWVPWLYERLARPEPEARVEVVRTTALIYGLLLLGALVLCLAAGPVVRTVAGPRFVAAMELLPLLAPAAALGGMYYFATGFLFYAGRTGLLSAITVGCAVLQVALTLSLVGRYAAHGVAVATLLTAFVYWLATAVAAGRTVPMPWLDAWHRKRPRGPA